MPAPTCANTRVCTRGGAWGCAGARGVPLRAGRWLGGRGRPAEAPARVHVAARQQRACAVSVQLLPHDRAHARGSVRTGGCSRPPPCPLPVAPGGTRAVPRALARVRCRRAPCEERRAETPLAAGTMRLPAPQETVPREDKAWGWPWPGPRCAGTLLSPGDGTCGFAGLPGGAPYKCVSPAVANTRPHQPWARAVLCRGAGMSVQQQRAGRRGHGHWQHLRGALVHAGARARPHETCPCTASLHAVNPWALGFARTHASRHVGTGGGGGRLVCMGACPSPRHVHVVLRRAGATRSVHVRVQGVGIHVRVLHVPAACAPCQGAPCPAAWGATPPALHVGCPWAAPSNAPSPAPTNPLSPLPPAGCKLSCHTKCQSKVRLVPQAVPIPAWGAPGTRAGVAMVHAS